MKDESQQEIAERELADKIKPLIDEAKALAEKRACGVTLEKNEYIGERSEEIEKQIEHLKVKKS